MSFWWEGRAREEDDEGFGDERASQRARELRPSRDQAMGRSRGPLASGEDETAWFGHRYAIFLGFFFLFLSLVCIFGRGVFGCWSVVEQNGWLHTACCCDHHMTCFSSK